MNFSFAGVHINKPYFHPSIEDHLEVKAPAVSRQQSEICHLDHDIDLCSVKPFAVVHMNKCSGLPVLHKYA